MLIINNIIIIHDKKYIEITTVVLLCIISGTRYLLGGTDYYLYNQVYNNLPTIKEFVANFNHLYDYYKTYNFEVGYLFFNSLFKTFGFNYFGFTLIHSIIFYSCLYKGLKRYSYNFNLLILVFLYKMFFYNTFISMRQSIALAIFFVSMHFIEERKFTKYILSCLFAMLFHNSALFLFPLYLIHYIELSKKRIIIANIIFIPTILVSYFNLPVIKLFSFILVVFKNSIAFDKASKLINGDTFSSIGIFHTFEYLLIMFLIIVYYDKIIKISIHSEFIIKMFLILLPIFTLFRGYEILTRIKDYLTLTYAIILGYLCLMQNKEKRFVVQIGTIIICAYGFFRFILLFDHGAMLPYQSYLLKGIGIFYN